MDILKDECCLCYEMNLVQTSKDGNLNCIRMTCCGKCFCKSCGHKYQVSLVKAGREWTCPMCRAPKAENHEEKFERALIKAKEAKSWAEEVVGGCYYIGEGVTQNYKKAFEFFSRAAAQGEGNSLNWVGSMYENGKGVDQSYEQAFHFYSQAAELGLATGQYNLALCYENGKGVEESVERSVECYTRAADNEKGGVPGAQYHLAYCYENGEGVEKSNKMALHFHTLAAESNHKDAQWSLALTYKKGEIGSKSHPLAIYWFKQCLKDNKDEEECTETKEKIESMLSTASEICASCKKKRGGDVKLTLKCSRCHSVYYCNSICQTTHWKKEGGHKKECRAP